MLANESKVSNTIYYLSSIFLRSVNAIMLYKYNYAKQYTASVLMWHGF